MKSLKIISAILLLSVVLTSVQAETETHFNRVNLNIAVSEEITADTIVGILEIQLQGKDNAALIAKVNNRIAAALKTLKSFKGIKAETLNYSTRPLYHNGRQTGLYEVAQSIRIESMDFEQFSQAVGKLQSSLELRSVNYRLSKQARTASEDRLTSEVIRQFNQRAKKISTDFGFHDYRIVNVNIGGTPRYNFREAKLQHAVADMAVSAAPPPVFQAGEQSVEISLNGTIEMVP